MRGHGQPRERATGALRGRLLRPPPHPAPHHTHVRAARRHRWRSSSKRLAPPLEYTLQLPRGAAERQRAPWAGSPEEAAPSAPSTLPPHPPSPVFCYRAPLCRPRAGAKLFVLGAVKSVTTASSQRGRVRAGWVLAPCRARTEQGQRCAHPPYASASHHSGGEVGSRAVRISQPPSVMTSVCSNCAERAPSSVTAVLRGGRWGWAGV